MKNLVTFINETKFEVNEKELIQVVRYTLNNQGIKIETETTISIVDLEEIQRLNNKWMGYNEPTDVLSFPIDELRPYEEPPENSVLGDIVLCPEYAYKNAKEMGHTLREELLLLTIHSVLHLLGYDHRVEKEKKIMFDLQRRILLEFLATL